MVPRLKEIVDDMEYEWALLHAARDAARDAGRVDEFEQRKAALIAKQMDVIRIASSWDIASINRK